MFEIPPTTNRSCKPTFRSSIACVVVHFTQIEGEEMNIGIKYVERALMSLRNGRVCAAEGIRKFLERGMEKLYRMSSNINRYLDRHPVSKQ